MGGKGAKNLRLAIDKAIKVGNIESIRSKGFIAEKDVKKLAGTWST